MTHYDETVYVIVLSIVCAVCAGVSFALATGSVPVGLGVTFGLFALAFARWA